MEKVHGPRASVGGAKYGGTLGDLDMSEYLQVMTKQLAEMQAQHQQFVASRQGDFRTNRVGHRSNPRGAEVPALRTSASFSEATSASRNRCEDITGQGLGPGGGGVSERRPSSAIKRRSSAGSGSGGKLKAPVSASKQAQAESGSRSQSTVHGGARRSLLYPDASGQGDQGEGTHRSPSVPRRASDGRLRGPAASQPGARARARTPPRGPQGASPPAVSPSTVSQPSVTPSISPSTPASARPRTSSSSTPLTVPSPGFPASYQRPGYPAGASPTDTEGTSPRGAYAAYDASGDIPSYDTPGSVQPISGGAHRPHGTSATSSAYTSRTVSEKAGASGWYSPTPSARSLSAVEGHGSPAVAPSEATGESTPSLSLTNTPTVTATPSSVGAVHNGGVGAGLGYGEEQEEEGLPHPLALAGQRFDGVDSEEDEDEAAPHQQHQHQQHQNSRQRAQCRPGGVGMPLEAISEVSGLEASLRSSLQTAGSFPALATPPGRWPAPKQRPGAAAGDVGEEAGASPSLEESITYRVPSVVASEDLLPPPPPPVVWQRAPSARRASAPVVPSKSPAPPQQQRGSLPPQLPPAPAPSPGQARQPAPHRPPVIAVSQTEEALRALLSSPAGTDGGVRASRSAESPMGAEVPDDVLKALALADGNGLDEALGAAMGGSLREGHGSDGSAARRLSGTGQGRAPAGGRAQYLGTGQLTGNPVSLAGGMGTARSTSGAAPAPKRVSGSGSAASGSAAGAPAAAAASAGALAHSLRSQAASGAAAPRRPQTQQQQHRAVAPPVDASIELTGEGDDLLSRTIEIEAGAPGLYTVAMLRGSITSAAAAMAAQLQQQQQQQQPVLYSRITRPSGTGEVSPAPSSRRTTTDGDVLPQVPSPLPPAAPQQQYPPPPTQQQNYKPSPKPQRRRRVVSEQEAELVASRKAAALLAAAAAALGDRPRTSALPGVAEAREEGLEEELSEACRGRTSDPAGSATPRAPPRPRTSDPAGSPAASVASSAARRMLDGDTVLYGSPSQSHSQRQSGFVGAHGAPVREMSAMQAEASSASVIPGAQSEASAAPHGGLRPSQGPAQHSADGGEGPGQGAVTPRQQLQSRSQPELGVRLDAQHAQPAMSSPRRSHITDMSLTQAAAVAGSGGGGGLGSSMRQTRSGKQLHPPPVHSSFSLAGYGGGPTSPGAASSGSRPSDAGEAGGRASTTGGDAVAAGRLSVTSGVASHDLDVDDAGRPYHMQQQQQEQQQQEGSPAPSPRGNSALARPNPPVAGGRSYKAMPPTAGPPLAAFSRAAALAAAADVGLSQQELQQLQGQQAAGRRRTVDEGEGAEELGVQGSQGGMREQELHVAPVGSAPHVHAAQEQQHEGGAVGAGQSPLAVSASVAKLSQLKARRQQQWQSAHGLAAPPGPAAGLDAPLRNHQQHPASASVGAAPYHPRPPPESHTGAPPPPQRASRYSGAGDSGGSDWNVPGRLSAEPSASTTVHEVEGMSLTAAARAAAARTSAQAAIAGPGASSRPVTPGPGALGDPATLPDAVVQAVTRAASGARASVSSRGPGFGDSVVGQQQEDEQHHHHHQGSHPQRDLHQEQSEHGQEGAAGLQHRAAAYASSERDEGRAGAGAGAGAARASGHAGLTVSGELSLGHGVTGADETGPVKWAWQTQGQGQAKAAAGHSADPSPWSSPAAGAGGGTGQQREGAGDHGRGTGGGGYGPGHSQPAEVSGELPLPEPQWQRPEDLERTRRERQRMGSRPLYREEQGQGYYQHGERGVVSAGGAYGVAASEAWARPAGDGAGRGQQGSTNPLSSTVPQRGTPRMDDAGAAGAMSAGGAGAGAGGAGAASVAGSKALALLRLKQKSAMRHNVVVKGSEDNYEEQQEHAASQQQQHQQQQPAGYRSSRATSAPTYHSPAQRHPRQEHSEAGAVGDGRAAAAAAVAHGYSWAPEPVAEEPPPAPPKAFLKRRSVKVSMQKVDWSHVKPKTNSRNPDYYNGAGSPKDVPYDYGQLYDAATIKVRANPVTSPTGDGGSGGKLLPVNVSAQKAWKAGGQPPVSPTQDSSNSRPAEGAAASAAAAARRRMSNIPPPPGSNGAGHGYGQQGGAAGGGSGSKAAGGGKAGGAGKGGGALDDLLAHVNTLLKDFDKMVQH